MRVAQARTSFGDAPWTRGGPDAAAKGIGVAPACAQRMPEPSARLIRRTRSGHKADAKRTRCRREADAMVHGVSGLRCAQAGAPPLPPSWGSSISRGTRGGGEGEGVRLLARSAGPNHARRGTMGAKRTQGGHTKRTQGGSEADTRCGNEADPRQKRRGHPMRIRRGVRKKDVCFTTRPAIRLKPTLITGKHFASR